MKSVLRALMRWCQLMNGYIDPFFFWDDLSPWWLRNHLMHNHSTIANRGGEWEYDHVGGWQEKIPF